MKYFRLVLLGAFLSVGGLLLSGCSSGPELPSDLPKLTPCKLTVVQDGTPLAGATVTLTMQGQPWYPCGSTNEKGEVELYTNGKYKGVPAGTYKISVAKTETEPSKLGTAPPEGDPQYGAWMAKSAQEKRNTYSLVEKQYTDAKTTPLEITIPGGETMVNAGKAVKEKI